MNYFSIHREPFRAEQKLSSFIIGAAKHLILLFCPKGFSYFKAKSSSLNGSPPGEMLNVDGLACFKE